MIQDIIVILIVMITLFFTIRQWFKKKRAKCVEDGVTDTECAGCTLSHFCKQRNSDIK